MKQLELADGSWWLDPGESPSLWCDCAEAWQEDAEAPLCPPGKLQCTMQRTCATTQSDSATAANVRNRGLNDLWRKRIMHDPSLIFNVLKARRFVKFYFQYTTARRIPQEMFRIMDEEAGAHPRQQCPETGFIERRRSA